MANVKKLTKKLHLSNYFQVLSLLTFASCFTFSTPTFANGALPYCMGAKMCQMGGAGVAIPLDSTSGNVNPALMANVGRDAALDPIIVCQKESVNATKAHLTAGTPLPPPKNQQTNRKTAYVAGYSGFNYDLNPEWSVGFSTSGGGNNAKYRKSIISPAIKAPRRLETMAALVSSILAYKPTCDQSYGLALMVGYLQMKNNLTKFPSGIVTRGDGRTDWGFGIGARLGGQWDASEFLSFGAAVSSPTFFQKLKKYHDVLKHAPRLPVIATGGFALHINKETDFLFDLEGLFWKENAFTGKRPPIGQGWRDVLVFKTGLQHKVNPELQVRIGYNYGRTPIQSKFVLFNALDEVITVSEHIISGGFTYDITKAITVDFGLAWMFNKKLTDNGKGPAGLAAKGLQVQARGLVITLGTNLKY